MMVNVQKKKLFLFVQASGSLCICNWFIPLETKSKDCKLEKRNRIENQARVGICHHLYVLSVNEFD